MKSDKDSFTLMWRCRYETSLDFIKKVENYLHINFPLRYIEIIKSYDGFGLKVCVGEKEYEPTVEITKDRREIIDFNQYREYKCKENIEISPFIESRLNDLGWLPVSEKMVVFGGTAGKHLYVFDYRDNDKEPSILFWDTDQIIDDAFELNPEEFKEIYDMDIEEGKNNGFYKIAETFDEFMDIIQPYISKRKG